MKKKKVIGNRKLSGELCRECKLAGEKLAIKEFRKSRKTAKLKISVDVKMFPFKTISTI